MKPVAGPVAVCLGILLVTVFLSEPAFAQCAMCRTALEQNAPVAASFNRGILFLLSMPYLVFGTLAGGFFWLRKRRESLPGE